MFKPLKNYIAEWQEKKGIVASTRRGAVETFTALAAAGLPDTLKTTFRPLHARRGVLTVACKNASIAALLKSREAELMAELDRRCPDEPVERLRLILSTWR